MENNLLKKITEVQVIISKVSNEQLIEIWTQYNKREKEDTTYKVRTWILEEIEKRFPEEYNEFADNYESGKDITEYIKIGA